MWILWWIIFSYWRFEDTHQNNSWRPQRIHMWILCKVFSHAQNFCKQCIWKDTSIQFMKVTRITNVFLVANHFPMHIIWKSTSTQFIKFPKITNVRHVANRFLKMKGFMKAAKISNVNLVINCFLQHNIWRGTSSQSRKATKITNVNLVAIHILQQEI